jgi:IgA Peptidase M64
MGTADGSVIGITQVVNHGDSSSRWNLVILGDGYRQSDLARFDADAQNFIATMKQTAPFDELWNAINVYRIDVASTDSGAADPVACGGTGAAPHTYFDATFCGDGQIRRLLTVNNDTVHGVVNQLMPQAHMIIVMQKGKPSASETRRHCKRLEGPRACYTKRFI